MPRGHPDDAMIGGGQIVQPVTDLGELAARLGSPDLYERGGNVLFMDSFEHGVGLWDDGSGVGVATTFTLEGGASIGGDYHGLFTNAGSGIIRNVTTSTYTPALSNIGAELAFTLLSATAKTGTPDDITLHFGLDVYNGSRVQKSRVDLVVTNNGHGQAKYQDNALAMVSIGNPVIYRGGYAIWHRIKWVIDPVLGIYRRLQIDGTTYDVADIDLYDTADASAPRIDIFFESATLGKSFGVDAVLITQNEPD